MSRPIKGLGEIALRVSNLDAMQRFYADVIGLELLKRFDDAAFFSDRGWLRRTCADHRAVRPISENRLCRSQPDTYDGGPFRVYDRA